MLIDAHCHLQAEEFDADRDAVLRRLHEQGIRCIVVGNQLDDSGRAVTLAESNEGLYATVGLHPMFVAEEEYEEEPFSKLAEHPKVVGIGEIGLDYYRLWADTPQEEQKVKNAQRDLFLAQLSLAKKVGKPVVIHCRDAYDDLLAVIEEHQDMPFMLHTFLGTAEMAKRFLDLGVWLSFSGIVTFEDEEPLLETVRSVPLDRMMIETDAPHLAPVPYRSKRNEPTYIAETAKKIAELKALPLETIVEQTAENARQFFQLP